VCAEPNIAAEMLPASGNRQKVIHMQTADSHPPAIGKFGLKIPIHVLKMEVFGDLTL